jgi:hypothetical protein
MIPCGLDLSITIREPMRNFVITEAACFRDEFGVIVRTFLVIISLTKSI